MKMPIAPESMRNGHGGMPPPECRLDPAAGAPHVMRKDMRPASAVMTEKEREKYEVTQELGRADDRPVAETPPRPARGAGRKGIAEFRRFPTAGRESCDLSCTGREPSLAGRAPHGSPTGFKPARIVGGHCQVWKNMTPKVRSTRTTSAPLSRIALMTADHHRRGRRPSLSP